MSALESPKRIAVIGIGLMGAGIASVLSDAGHSVSAFDAHLPPLEALAEAFPEIKTTSELEEAVGGAEIVIEAIVEALQPKLELFGKLAELCPEAIVCSNTSSLSTDELSAGTRDPTLFAITHFFNHPRTVPLVELVPGPETADETLATLKDVLEGAGKLPVVLRRAVPGFVANRLQAALLREAFSLVADGVATPEDIDLVVRGALGARWAAAGPMMVTDLGGLDIWKAVTTQLFPLLNSDTTPPAAITDRVDCGELGAKTGSGIYAHDPEGDAAVKQRIADHFVLEFPNNVAQ